MPAVAQKSLIEYPCDFPIKVMGASGPEFVQAVVDVASQLDPFFCQETRLEQRKSQGGRYQSLTLMIRASSREQLDELYQALSRHPLVKVVL